MGTPVLHPEFTPVGGMGGVSAAGYPIVGPDEGATYSYARNKLVVFDPTSKTADTYNVTLPVTVYDVPTV